MLRTLTIAAMLVPFAAATAGGAPATHEEVWQPVGKTTKLYRLKDRPAASTATRHHQAGKSHHMVAPAQARHGTELAAAEERAER